MPNAKSLTWPLDVIWFERRVVKTLAASFTLRYAWRFLHPVDSVLSQLYRKTSGLWIGARYPGGWWYPGGGRGQWVDNTPYKVEPWIPNRDFRERRGFNREVNPTTVKTVKIKSVNDSIQSKEILFDNEWRIASNHRITGVNGMWVWIF